MPRISQNTEQYLRKDFLRAIRVGLADIDMKQGELADRAGIARSTLSKRLKEPEKLLAEQIRGIVGVLKPDIKTLLLFLGYDTKDIKKFREEAEHA